ncbi:hypothetical protein TI04_04000 [Achromatium sp. WMS2]|nr:hypothetical protein TI04_04000 [Achromatium sp. WMS2]
MLPNLLQVLRITLIIALTYGLAILGAFNGLSSIATLSLGALLTWHVLANYQTPIKAIITISITCLLMLMLTGAEQNITIADLSKLLMICLLVWILQSWPDNDALDFVAIGITLLIALTRNVTWLPHNAPIINQSMNQNQRLIQAIGGDEARVTLELKQRFGNPGSNEWNYDVGQVITSSKSWPLSIFFRDFTDDGNELAVGLWGQRVDQLQIPAIQNSLNPLLTCRNAMRSIFDKNEIVYTPFFQVEDFALSNSPWGNLQNKVKVWAQQSTVKYVIMQQDKGRCQIELKRNDTLISWINQCLITLSVDLIDKPNQPLLTKLQRLGSVCNNDLLFR